MNRPPSLGTDRNDAVRRVLQGLLVANIAVVLVKLVVSWRTGSLAVLGDAIHSSVDALNNVLGLAVMRVAAKGPDDEHPYGHAKFESLGALVVVVFLSVTIFELMKGAIGRLSRPAETLQVDLTQGVLLGLTLLINIWVSWYETRAGRRLKSELLLADAAHTRVDVFITAAVIVGLVLSKLGHAWADSVLALVVSLLIARVGFQIFRRSVPTLVDERALEGGTIQQVAEGVPGVMSAYAIRSRTAADVRFAELTIAVDGKENVAAAHRIADQVEQRIRDNLEVQEIVVHVEPC
ncbi:MAG: cation diffusion facilitator family transporter [Gemmatimonadota bacterium]